MPCATRFDPVRGRAFRRSRSSTSASSSIGGIAISSSRRFSPAACWPRPHASAARRNGRDCRSALRRWLAAFDLQVDAVRDLGFDSSFIHCWRFYLAYCAAGFDSDTTDVAQYTLMLDR
jgi:cyclopropane fatty-acyl-phospholipid synthase-like methyltransferase